MTTELGMSSSPYIRTTAYLATAEQIQFGLVDDDWAALSLITRHVHTAHNKRCCILVNRADSFPSWSPSEGRASCGQTNMTCTNEIKDLKSLRVLLTWLIKLFLPLVMSSSSLSSELIKCRHWKTQLWSWELSSGPQIRYICVSSA